MSMKNFRNLSVFHLVALKNIKLEYIFLDYEGGVSVHLAAPDYWLSIHSLRLIPTIAGQTS